MNKKEEILKLRADLNELRGMYSLLEHKVDNPAQFKKGDKVAWKFGLVAGVMEHRYGVVSSCKLEHISSYKGWRSYQWDYTIINDKHDIHTISENRLSYDTHNK